MKKLFTLLSVFGLVSFIHLAANAKADADCMKMWKQAKKTCKGDRACMLNPLRAAGMNIIDDGYTVFCKGDPNKGGSAVTAKKKSEDGDHPLVKDRSKSKKKDSDRPILKRKQGISFE